MRHPALWLLLMLPACDVDPTGAVDGVADHLSGDDAAQPVQTGMEAVRGAAAQVDHRAVVVTADATAAALRARVDALREQRAADDGLSAPEAAQIDQIDADLRDDRFELQPLRTDPDGAVGEIDPRVDRLTDLSDRVEALATGPS
jgi:hypothetical protein